MHYVSAVIGSNYGDEGKGHVTDWLSLDSSLVVRFNGGAQAGHTVTTADGRKHVFHHFGSGTLAGAGTFLSRFFIANPMTFVEELQELRKLGCEPVLAIDPRCLVSTPYDMMLNQQVETKRGGMKHGSCGMGIHETIIRNESKFGFDFGWLAFASVARIEERLNQIRRMYVPDRARRIGVGARQLKFLYDDGILDHFLRDIETMRALAWVETWGGKTLWESSNVIFEGAQGLRLDENAPDFPYVTHSKTGLHNVLLLMEGAGIENELNVIYVTRPYFTRHGAGPLPNELPNLHSYYPKFRDDTNTNNAWQGLLRFSLFDEADFLDTVLMDLTKGLRHRIAAHLAVTCVDQLEDGRVHMQSGSTLQIEDLACDIQKVCLMKSFTLFNGPTKHNYAVGGDSELSRHAEESSLRGRHTGEEGQDGDG